MNAIPSADELRKLPLTPTDGFVLSRVDGSSSEEDIVALTGLAREQVRASLERLASLGLVTMGGDGPARMASAVNHRENRPPAPASGAVPAAVPDTTSRTTSSTPSSTPTGAGNLDLASDEQRRIDDLYAKLDALDHYALLGVTTAAEKKELKRAYFERAALYHPDRYFRRNVGPFKPKLEAIFAKITLAHDVLTDKVQRAEYDAYLGQVAHTRELEARVKRAEESARNADVIEVPPTGPVPTRSTPPGTSLTPPAGSTPNVPGEPIRRPSRPIVPIDPQARRDLLAKHLRGGRSMTPSKMPPAAPGPLPPSSDPDALKRHFDQRKHDVARAQAQRHRASGDQARAAGDVIGAAASYKAALQFLPEDAELQRLHQEASHLAESQLVDTYRNQARYEEKSGRWPDAAHSWSKVAQILPGDAHAHERAANALLEASGNLHDAASFAQRAVTLAPTEALYRKLLARIYLEAGLLKNARREIDAAEQLAPGDVSIAALAKRLAEAIGR